jgi:hypothetical protein
MTPTELIAAYTAELVRLYGADVAAACPVRPGVRPGWYHVYQPRLRDDGSFDPLSFTPYVCNHLLFVALVTQLRRREAR